MNLRIAQEARAHSEGWWDWAVWLEGSREALEEVDYVEYVLHPTFQPPVRKVTDRDSQFRLELRGWGEFNIKCRVHLEDDDDLIVLDHWLELDDIAPTRGQESYDFRDSGYGKQPRLYLSSSIADIELAYALKDALEDDGIEVLLKQDMDEDYSLESYLETQRRGLMAGLFLVSEMRNPWLMRDYWMLEKSKIASLVVQIGEPRDLPSEMRELPRFVIKDASETRQVATSIARRVRRQF